MSSLNVDKEVCAFAWLLMCASATPCTGYQVCSQRSTDLCPKSLGRSQKPGIQGSVMHTLIQLESNQRRIIDTKRMLQCLSL